MEGEGPAIGIDLGTAYSCAAIYRNGHVEFIPDDVGNRAIPSCVAFTRTERLVGSRARSQAHMNPTNTIYNVKKIIGRRFGDDSVQKAIKLLPFGVCAGPRNKPMVSIHYKGEEKLFAPQEIAAMVLSRTKEMAEAYLRTKIRNAVVSIPAHFNHLQRQATRDAVTFAGLNVIRLISEPTAAALAYYKRNCTEVGKRTVLVFDLGASMFDVTVITIEEGFVEVKATRGDDNLGGDDFDERMVDHFLLEFQGKSRVDVSSNPRAMSKLRTACEGAKKNLSTNDFAIVVIDSLAEGINFSSRISRSEFEELNEDLFQRCIQLTKDCLGDAGMDVGSIDDVIPVGGSTRIRRIQQLLRDLFNVRKLCTRAINPDEAVAYGAAVQAAILSADGSMKIQRTIVVDATPWSLGIEDHEGAMNVLIPKNTTIPTKKQQVFSTYLDEQTCFPVRVYEGERARTSENNFLGCFELSGIHPAPRGTPQITVCFEIDADKLLYVSIVDETPRPHKNRIPINSDMVGEEETIEMTAQIQRYRPEDEEHRMPVQWRNSLESYALSMLGAIQLDKFSSRLRCEERKRVEDAVKQAISWLDRYQKARPYAIWRKLKDLENVWKPIVTEISSRGIQPSTEVEKELAEKEVGEASSSGGREDRDRDIDVETGTGIS